MRTIDLLLCKRMEANDLDGILSDYSLDDRVVRFACLSVVIKMETLEFLAFIKKASLNTLSCLGCILTLCYKEPEEFHEESEKEEIDANNMLLKRIRTIYGVHADPFISFIQKGVTVNTAQHMLNMKKFNLLDNIIQVQIGFKQDLEWIKATPIAIHCTFGTCRNFVVEKEETLKKYPMCPLCANRCQFDREASGEYIQLPPDTKY